MLITLWDGLALTRGKTLDVDWSDLPALLEARPASSLWSPSRFRDSQRGDAFLIDCGAVVLDHDRRTVDVHTAARALEGYRAIVHPTKSEGRWRAIIPLSRRVSPDEYRETTRELMAVFNCNPESAVPSQGWFPPSPGACIEVGGEPLTIQVANPRLSAWIAGDWGNPVIRDLSKPIDRSAVDMLICHAMAGQGATRDAFAKTIRARGDLSHAHTDYYIDHTWRKAAAYQARASANGLWLQSPGAKSRPVIRLGPDIDRVADEAAEAIAALDYVYQRGGSLVSIIEGPRGSACAALSVANIGDELSRAAVFVRPMKDGQEKPVEPPERVARILADRRSHSARPIAFLSAAPIVRPDGSIRPIAGYDAETQSVYSGAQVSCKEAPTQPDAYAALRALREPFEEFPFQDPSMVDVVIANILTVVCRSVAGPNTPLFVYDASQKGSGKTLLSTCVSMVALGASHGLWGWPSSDEELDKRLTSIALDAQPFVTFDEARNVGGGTLNMLLTGQGQQSFRPLGSSKVITADWRTVLAVTGNQLAIVGDTRRRTLHVRLTPDGSRAGRGYKRDLLTWIPMHRNRLLAAALDLVRAFILAGSPSKGPTMPSFEAWSRAIAGAILYAGGTDVLAHTHDEAQGDDDESDARGTLALWLALRWPQGATSRTIAADLGEDGAAFFPSDQARALFMEHRGLEARMRAVIAGARQTHPKEGLSQALGLMLRGWRDVATEGIVIRGYGRPRVWKAEVL